MNEIELNMRQSQSLLVAVNDHLFKMWHHVKELEGIENKQKGLDYHLARLKEEQDDLRYIKEVLERKVYNS